MTKITAPEPGDWARVKSKDTGHEYSTRSYDPDAHELVEGDAVNASGLPLPPVINEKVTSRKAPAAIPTPSDPSSGTSTV